MKESDYIEKEIKELKSKLENIEQLLKKQNCHLSYPLTDYKQPTFTQMCVKSVLAADYKDTEVLVSDLIDCNIEFNLKLRPLYPTTTSEALRLEHFERTLQASIYQNIKDMEKSINHYLRYVGI